jgi:hypothetical protein
VLTRKSAVPKFFWGTSQSSKDSFNCKCVLEIPCDLFTRDVFACISRLNIP